MSEIEIPNFGEVLAEHLGKIPPAALPYALAQLERTAADRYRVWAEEVPEHSAGILECANREDEIADRVEDMFPVTQEDKVIVDGIIPAAKDTYYEVFMGYTAIEQMTIQANAERQGAGAWQSLKPAYPELEEKLDELSNIELLSADYLDGILSAS
jgi:hypothetical protein